MQFSIIALEGHGQGIGLLSGKPGVLWQGGGNARHLPAAFQAVLSPAGYWLFMSTEKPFSFKYMNKQIKIKARQPKILWEQGEVISMCHLFQAK